MTKPVSSFLDSNISLISHHSESIDSLDYSDEGFVFDEDIMLSDAKMTDSTEEKPKMRFENKGKQSNNKHDKGSVEESLTETECSTTDTKLDKTRSDSDKIQNREETDNLKEKLILSLPKSSKIPKSKTFDMGSSVFNKRSDSYRFADSNNGSRNHVFLTSQECMVVPGSSKLPRETIASRLRFEKQHSQDRSTPHSSSCQSTGDGYHRGCAPDCYQTPLQRKDLLLRDLKRQVREMQTTCDEKDREIAMYKQHVNEETSKVSTQPNCRGIAFCGLYILLTR
jgi:hypothetical protein